MATKQMNIRVAPELPDRFNQICKENNLTQSETLRMLLDRYNSGGVASDEELTQAKGELQKTQALNAELQEAARITNDRLLEANENISRLTEENLSLQERCDELTRVKNEQEEEINELSHRQPDTITIEKPVPVAQPLPDNAMLLTDVTPFQRAMLELVSRYSGCLSVKEMLVDRFFMVYQIRGQGDYRIRKMKSEKIKALKAKFDNLNQEEQQ